jgi:hypothetical protein
MKKREKDAFLEDLLAATSPEYVNLTDSEKRRSTN